MTNWAPIIEQDFKIVDSPDGSFRVIYIWYPELWEDVTSDECDAMTAAREKLIPRIEHHREIAVLRNEVGWWKDRAKRLEADRAERDQDSPQSKLIRQVLEICALTENFDILMWQNDGSYIGVGCNDVFAWGCADCEEITPETLGLFQEAADELLAIEAEWWLAELYTAKVRKMRPQGAIYQSVDMTDTVVALFNSCGPDREAQFGNPYSFEKARTIRKQRIIDEAKKQLMIEQSDVVNG